MMMEPLVLWAGHFGIGLAYYLRFFLMKTEKEWEKEMKESEDKGKFSSREIEFAKGLLANKLLILVLYLLCGYVNLFIHAKRVYKNLKNRGN